MSKKVLVIRLVFNYVMEIIRVCLCLGSLYATFSTVHAH